jgi:hypothetical protein
MLPGLRFLFVAIVLAVSMVIFGLGAAALLRATHEEFASLPLKQMPEVTFGSREEPQQPTLAVLQVDTPAAEPPAADAPSAAADGTAPAAPPELSETATPHTADPAPSTEAVAEKPSELPRAEAPVEAKDAVKPDAEKIEDVKTDATKTGSAKPDLAKPDVAKSDAGASDVAETMTSPFGAHFKPPLPGHRPTQLAQTADKASPVAKRSSAKPAVAKRAHRRHVVRQPGLVRPAAPTPASQPASPFALE